LLPAICAAIAGNRLQGSVVERARTVGRETWPMWIALALYFVLRTASGAFGPLTAPSYYRFTLEPLSVLRNIGEYLDRAGTLAVAVALLYAGGRRRTWTMNANERLVVVLGALWAVGFFAITVFLPVRSDLYALTPAMGFALIAGAIASSVQRTSIRRFARATLVFAVLILLAIPIYRIRNRRWVEPANLSASVLRSTQVQTLSLANGRILFVDDPTEKIGLDDAFGSLLPDAVHLVVSPRWDAELREKPPTAGEIQRYTLVVALKDGVVVPISNARDGN